MRQLRYILVLLFILSYRGLSAQELDLYDFRSYKRFGSAEEWVEPERDTVEIVKSLFDDRRHSRSLDYALSVVGATRRGYPFYRHKQTLNDVAIARLGYASIRALQLEVSDSLNNTRLTIDTLREDRTMAGFAFSSRNMPYSISISTAQHLAHDWSIAANMVARTGRDLHIDGLFGNSIEINAIASKLFNKGERLSFAIFAKPSMRSIRVASTQEAFRLMGNNLYNPAWGYQSGKVRNPRIRREFLPTAFAGYEGVLSERTRLKLAATATVGIERYSNLDWFDAQTPSPDNYRYMPSYFSDEEDIFHAVENSWLTNDTRYTQIDFDRIIATNRLNGGTAVYAISDRVERIIATSLRGEAVTTLDKGSISYGIEVDIRNSRQYKQMRDLLGAEYVTDIDYFLLDDDTFGNSLQNNLATPDRRIAEGDRFGYDYAIRQHNASLFGTYYYSTSRLHLGVAAKVGYCDISRRGFYRKELFKDNSFGVSRHLRFSPYALRISADYTIGVKHLIRGNIATEATPCDAEDMFLQSQYNNRTIDNPSMRSSCSAEFEYMFRHNDLTLSAALFISAELNDTRVRHLYDDLSGEYADIVTSNMDYLRYGLEAEAEYRFAEHFRVVASVSLGRYKYASNSLVTIYSDTSNILFADHIESRTKGLSIGNMPQVAATASLSYLNRGWIANINLNYAGLRFIEPSAVMRTERVLRMAVSPEDYTNLMTQERLKDAFTVDLSLSKRLYLSRLSKRIYATKANPQFVDRYPRSNLTLRLGVRNLLGSTNIVYMGYESSRLQRYRLADESIYNRQASRYIYAYPRTFYASATFSF